MHKKNVVVVGGLEEKTLRIRQEEPASDDEEGVATAGLAQELLSARCLREVR